MSQGVTDPLQVGPFVADQEDDGTWRVRHADEMKRCAPCRDWACIIAADNFADGGEIAARLCADVLTRFYRPEMGQKE